MKFFNFKIYEIHINRKLIRVLGIIKKRAYKVLLRMLYHYIARYLLMN